MAQTLRPPVGDKDHRQGLAGAPLELVEYGDYQCPQCGSVYPMIKRIQDVLGRDLTFIFRNFPLSKSHPQAFQAAVATEAASKQGAFWAMHDIIFENQSELERLPFGEFAQILGLDIERLELDLEDPRLPEKVDIDFANGIRSGVTGTPAFFINGERYKESWEESVLLARLIKVLTRT